MSQIELCVDLGSNYTTIYKKDCGVVLREPTLAILETSGKNMKPLEFGNSAEKLFGKTPSNEVFVRPVVEGVIKNVNLTKKLMLYFFGKVVNFSLIKPAIRLVVLTPVGLKEKEYEDYRSVFYSLGFAKVDFILSPIVARKNNHPSFASDRASLLVNIGAGKTELAVCMGNNILDACSINVGGNMLDKRLVEYLQTTKSYVLSSQNVEKVKREVASLYETDTSSVETSATDPALNNNFSCLVYAKDIIKPVYETYFKILQTVQAFLNGCSAETQEDIRNYGIVVYGGGANVTGLEKFFKNILGISVFVADDAETFAIRGAESLFMADR